MFIGADSYKDFNSQVEAISYYNNLLIDEVLKTASGCFNYNQLALKIGCSRQYISDIKIGRRRMPYYLFRRILPLIEDSLAKEFVELLFVRSWMATVYLSNTRE